MTPTWTEETRGLCPVCVEDVPATVFAEAGQVWIEQICPRHGAHRALLASEAEEYTRLRQFVPDRANGGGCCGGGGTCGPNGTPPVCVLLLEITTACNLRCPTCYADARGHDFMTWDEAKRRLDTFFAAQPALDVLMLSGENRRSIRSLRLCWTSHCRIRSDACWSIRTACGWHRAMNC